jgi:uncharacterized membrane protein
MPEDPYRVPGARTGELLPREDAAPELVSYTHIVYALHTLSVVIGITSPATIVGAFIFGVPSIIAVIMNYVRRPAVRGTWLDSHFSWQIRTFWFTALWAILVSVVSAPLVLLFGLGVVTWIVGMFLVGLWLIYRVARGWLALRDRRPMYA